MHKGREHQLKNKTIPTLMKPSHDMFKFLHRFTKIETRLSETECMRFFKKIPNFINSHFNSYQMKETGLVASAFLQANPKQLLLALLQQERSPN